MTTSFKIFRKIAQMWQNYDTIGRIFWVVTLTISFYGMATFSYYTFFRYYFEPVSMSIDTNYMSWSLPFPAISVCLIKGKSSIPLQKYINSLNISYNGSYTNFVRSIHMCMFASANQVDSSLAKCAELRHDYNIDLNNLIDMFLPNNCKEFLESLKYGDESYDDCSEVFKFHKTELGYCFIANSIVDYGFSLKNLKLHYTYKSPNTMISMRLKVFKLWQYVFHVHSPEDLPFYNSVSNEIFLTETRHSFVTTVIITDEAAAAQSVQERGCRFPHEKLHGSPFHYSFSTCMSYLRIQLELEFCNCTFSTSPEMCDINNKARNLAVENSVCLPSCTEQILVYAGQSEMSPETNNSFTDISIEVLNFPYMRFVRTVARTNMDLAVSVAGIAGLFFGVSVLNFVEVIYYLVTRL